MKKILLLAILSLFVVSCASRTPTPKHAEKSLNKFFVKYGKKYPTTIYGKGIDKIEVFSTGEVQYLYISVDAIVVTKAGVSQPIEATLHREMGRWKVVSWERAQ